MKAVFKHEMSCYFTGLAGYVFAAFLLLFVGIFTMVYNLRYGLVNFEIVLANMSFIFLIIVPILTMRTLAEEKRQRTDQLLYSLPISMTDVVLGKFAALMVMLAIPMAVVCLYPLILKGFGNVHLQTAYASITGFFFLGASLIAIGVFVSSLTESQGVAAGLCFVVMLLNYFISSLANFASSSSVGSYIGFAVCILLIGLLIRIMTKNTGAALTFAVVLEIALLVIYLLFGSKFEGLFPRIMSQLSLFERFGTFTSGIFDVTGLVYYVSVTVLMLFLAIQSMEKRRWSE